MKTLKGKTVLITGASNGIGKSSAYMFAKNGSNLILIARRKDRLDAIEEDLKNKFGIEVISIPLDVRNYEDVKKQISNLPEKWRNIDILLNNAGLSRGLNKLQDGVLSDWEEMLDTNVKGLLYVTKEVLPLMLNINSGHIINIGSIAGREVYPGGNVYCASKFSVDALTKSIRIDLLENNIKVSTVDPGLVETEFSLVRYHGDKEKAKKTYDGITPLTPDNVAEAIEFIVSREENFVVAEMVLFPKYQGGANFVHRKK